MWGLEERIREEIGSWEIVLTRPRKIDAQNFMLLRDVYCGIGTGIAEALVDVMCENNEIPDNPYIDLTQRKAKEAFRRDILIWSYIQNRFDAKATAKSLHVGVKEESQQSHITYLLRRHGINYLDLKANPESYLSAQINPEFEFDRDQLTRLAIAELNAYERVAKNTGVFFRLSGKTKEDLAEFLIDAAIEAMPRRYEEDRQRVFNQYLGMGLGKATRIFNANYFIDQLNRCGCVLSITAEKSGMSISNLKTMKKYYGIEIKEE